MKAACKRCGAAIVWAKQVRKEWVNGKWETRPVIGAKANPVNAESSAEGNVVLNAEAGVYRFATGNELEMAKFHGKRLWRSHFETCRHAAEFRK